MRFSGPSAVAGSTVLRGQSARLRPIDANEVMRHSRLRGYHFVDPPGQADRIGIKRTQNDTSVIGLFMMQTNEMPAVEREEDTILDAQKGQYVDIRRCPVCSPRFLDRQNIVA